MALHLLRTSSGYTVFLSCLYLSWWATHWGASKGMSIASHGDSAQLLVMVHLIDTVSEEATLIEFGAVDSAKIMCTVWDDVVLLSFLST